jgi:secreted Zn-dependent insulinase-like peptidase
MGTRKYPGENDFNDYLYNHSGYSNAYTGFEHTNYHFQVGYGHLKGALKRFSRLFIDPLFNTCCMLREIKVLNSGKIIIAMPISTDRKPVAVKTTFYMSICIFRTYYQPPHRRMAIHAVR